MAQFGLQPNGMIKLDDGTLWNPQDNLPPDPAPFNQTPMGNPLQPQTLPRMVAPAAPAPVVPQQAAPSSPAPAPTPAPASGMMFAGLPASMPVSAISAPTPDVPRPSFFGQGGTGRMLAGILGDALSVGTGHQATYAPAMQKRQEMQWQAQQDAYKQALEYQRQYQLAQYKNLTDDKRTPAQKDAEALGFKPGTQQYSDYIQKRTIEPVLGTVNGVTGLIDRSVTPQSGPPAEAVAYLRANPTLRAQFDQKYGAGAAASVLGQ